MTMAAQPSARYESLAMSLIRWIRKHGDVEASLVSGTVHVLSWCREPSGHWYRQLDVVSTFSEARRVLGY